MSVETVTRLTDAATAYREAKFELEHCTVRHREAVRELGTALRSMALAEAEVLEAEELLERRAGDPAILPEEIQQAAHRLKVTRTYFTLQRDIHLRLTAAVADRDQERLQARHTAAQARAALYEEATHV